MARVHVIGAGLAGLSAAVELSGGWQVSLYEAAPQAGGRCRSYFDSTLGMMIDNGNHLLLSGNRAALAYADKIGGADKLAGPDEAAFDFCDLARNRRWTLRPNAGKFPWRPFSPPARSSAWPRRPIAERRASPARRRERPQGGPAQRR